MLAWPALDKEERQSRSQAFSQGETGLLANGWVNETAGEKK